MSELVYNLESIEWVIDGYYHREHGPCRIYNNGSVRFSQIEASSYNRKAGPATIHATGEVLYKNADGDYHRTSGPAIIESDGSKEYWIDGYELSVDEFFLKYGVV